MTSPPGWHPDPVPPPPGQPAQLRYWDGTRWTEHVAPAQTPAASAAYGAYAGTQLSATTPDGVPLAGWWHRVGALVIDWVIVSLVVGVVALPWIRDIWESYRDFFDQVLADSENGSGSFDTAQFQRDIAGPAAAVAVVSLAVTFCYHVGFLMWKQATPGKLATGLRVRLRERPGPMPLTTVLLRWVGQFGVRLVGLVPVVGPVASVYLLLDYLWPLWDDRSQALHDKLAATNVVRVR